MKGHIRRYINEKHDVVTAEDMKIALESNGGVKGCNFIVAEVDVSEAPEAGSHFERVSYLNNFAYEEDSIRCWKAYKQGEGKTIKKPSGKTVTGLKIVEAQNTEIASKGKVSEQSSSTKPPLFFFAKNKDVFLHFILMRTKSIIWTLVNNQWKKKMTLLLTGLGLFSQNIPVK